MTNSEAIKLLKSKMDGSVDTSYEWCECVRLAIKALEEQESPNSIRINFVGEEEAEEFKEYLKKESGKDTNVTTTDCVSREEVRELFTTCIAEKGKPYDFLYKLNNLSSVTPTTQWHRIKTRPLTEEEKDEMCLNDNYYTFMYDCKMPDDGQEVLVKTQWGIEKTTYYTDDGCYFEDYEDEDDVIAWTELPKWEE